MNRWLVAFVLAPLAPGCGDAARTFVVLDNDYAPSPANAPVVYRAQWQAVSFQDPVLPGSSSDARSTVAASENTAYVVLAPGWDPTGQAPPTSLVVLQSRRGLEAHLNDTLHVRVDDSTFLGSCATGSPLSQAQTDFITRLVFPADFASLHYDAATCSTTPIWDAGAP